MKWDESEGIFLPLPLHLSLTLHNNTIRKS